METMRTHYRCHHIIPVLDFSRSEFSWDAHVKKKKGSWSQTSLKMWEYLFYTFTNTDVYSRYCPIAMQQLHSLSWSTWPGSPWISYPAEWDWLNQAEQPAAKMNPDFRCQGWLFLVHRTRTCSMIFPFMIQVGEKVEGCWLPLQWRQHPLNTPPFDKLPLHPVVTFLNL